MGRYLYFLLVGVASPNYPVFNAPATLYVLKMIPIGLLNILSQIRIRLR